MPVGRVKYCFLVPLSFQEFLSAVGDERLVALLNSFHLGSEIAGPIHAQLARRVRDYWLIGGMPEAVAAFAVGDVLLSLRRSNDRSPLPTEMTLESMAAVWILI